MVGNELVTRHLANWADWQRNSSTNLGYPKRALVAMGGGQSVEGVFEECCLEADRAAAEIMDTLVHDLQLNHRSAIYRRWLGCTIIIRNAEQTLSEAYSILSTKISRRGLA